MFKLPEWFNNLSATSKAIITLITSIIFIICLGSQAFSLGLDFKLKMQQIDKNTEDIAYEKCMRIKRNYEEDLNYYTRRYTLIHEEYVSKNKTMPPLIQEEWALIPNKIENIKTKKNGLECK